MKRAFISVWDKTGVVEFAQGLSRLGYEIISTGGTQRALQKANIPVTNVSDITGFPECLDGRVKTLHPMVHAGILAMRENEEHMHQLEQLGVLPIDIVAVNLYPFKQTIMSEDVTLELAIENIDIGGPTMLRAAAKNWQDVAVIVDPDDYVPVLEALNQEGRISKTYKFSLAVKVFENTAAYDALIHEYLRGTVMDPIYPEKLTLTFEKLQDLRYGENPHQSAAFYKEPLGVTGSLPEAEQLQGKELSFNNITDANGALELLKEFSDGEIAVVAIKHANPCGVAIGQSVYDAYIKAYECDPMSIFGGIVATNGTVDEQTAKKMSEIFLEIIIAPDYTPEALEVLASKQNLRVLRLESISQKLEPETMDIKRVMGGIVVQSCNSRLIGDISSVATERKPTEKELEDMMFAWKVVKHVKSNAIVVAKDGKTLGIGPGQTNRVWAARSAIRRSGDAAQGAVLASDAFFPFSDSVEAAANAGIAAIIQPGGSIRDQDSIDVANQNNIAMLFVGMRHFKH